MGPIAEPVARARIINSRGAFVWQTDCLFRNELVIACENARDDLGRRALVVDLRSLSLIGPEGERVLLELLNLTH